MNRLRGAWALATLSACFPFTPTVTVVGKSCNAAAECPDGFVCTDGSCQLGDGGSATTAGTVSGTTVGAGTATTGATAATTGGGTTASGSTTGATASAVTTVGATTSASVTGTTIGGVTATSITTTGATGSGTTGSGTTSGGTTSGTTGAACGFPNAPCCSNSSCNSGLTCIGGTVCGCDATFCTSGCCDENGCEQGTTDSACGPTGGTCDICTSFQVCSARACAACGDVDQTCCDPDGGGAACSAGLACDHTDHCICGFDGGACCADGQCQPGLACRDVGACMDQTFCSPPTGGATYQSISDQDPTAMALWGGSSSTTASAIFWIDSVAHGSVQSFDFTFPGSVTFSTDSLPPGGLAVYSPTGQVFWYDANAIYGCTSQTGGFVCNGGSFYQVDQGFSGGYVFGSLVLDPSGQTLYFGKSGGPNAGLDDCPVTTCANPNPVVAGAVPLGLAVSGSEVVWTDQLGYIGIYNTTSQMQKTSVLPNNVDAGALSGIAIDTGSIYFAVDDQVQRVSTAGGTASLFARAPPGGCPDAIAVSSTHVYWTDPCIGAIYRAAKGCIGGAPLETVWNQNSVYGAQEPMGLAVDNLNVYWTDPGGAGGGTVESVNQ